MERVPEGRRPEGRLHRSETEEEAQGERSGTRARRRQRRQHDALALAGTDGGHLVRVPGLRARAAGAARAASAAHGRRAADGGAGKDSRARNGGTGDRVGGRGSERGRGKRFPHEICRFPHVIYMERISLLWQRAESKRPRREDQEET